MEPPWPPYLGDLRSDHPCTRCGETISAGWRHYWPGCRRCAVWACAGQALMAVFGLDAHPWLYDEARPWCDDCGGTGFLPCQPQDMTTMRVSGICGVEGCGAPAFYLVRDEFNDGRWERVPDSSHHFNAARDEDHIAESGPGPLGKVLNDHLTRALT